LKRFILKIASQRSPGRLSRAPQGALLIQVISQSSTTLAATLK
jgi:hypothetical protein